jgi:hypothetical protein
MVSEGDLTQDLWTKCVHMGLEETGPCILGVQNNTGI